MTYTAKDKHTELLQVFTKYQNKKFLMVRPGGNHGDYLIYRGAEKLADSVGIVYESLGHKEFMAATIPEDTVVYVHGSGGFHPFWSGTPIDEMAKAVQNHKGVCILGPSTFFEDLAYIREFVARILADRVCSELYLFTRELRTQGMLKEVDPSKVSLGLAHDTALALERSDLIVDESSSNRKYAMYSMRIDKESKEIYYRPNPFVFWMDPAREVDTFDQWLALHENAEKVYTNRTHSGILSTILGKEVYFLPNQYHKNRSIWEFSLQQHGVNWIEKLPGSPFFDFIRRSGAYHKLVHSYKFNQLIRRIYAKGIL